jgi:hypothetical protein
LSFPPRDAASEAPALPDFAARPPGPETEAAFAAWAGREPFAALAATLAPEAPPHLAALQNIPAALAAHHDLAALLLWLAEAPERRATPAVLFAAACVATETHPDPRPDGALALLVELLDALPPSATREHLWPEWLERHLDAHPRVAADWLPLPATPP